jgi:hypothetical protein
LSARADRPGPVPRIDQSTWLVAETALAAEVARIKADVMKKTPENLVLQGRKIYSQCDEDGIISEIFSKLGGGKTFIEIGCGDGRENNTHALLLSGWKGVWVDASAEHIAYIESQLGGRSFRCLLVDQQFVTVKNIADLLHRYRAFLGSGDIDFLSIDIDGNDLHVLERSLTVLEPRVLCVEYNAKFPPPLSLSIRYKPEHAWAGDDYQGCSLGSLVETLGPKYTLLTCSMSGANAFFVRNEFAERFKIYPPADVFQPLRLHLTFLASGHPPSLKWLRDRLASDGGR